MSEAKHAEAIRLSSEVAAAAASGYQVVILVGEREHCTCTSLAARPSIHSESLAEWLRIIIKTLPRRGGA